MVMMNIAALMNRYSGTIALIVGGFSALGFAPLGWWPITLLSLAILIQLLLGANGPKHIFRIAWSWGVGHFTITLHWIAFAFTFQDAMPVWLGYGAVVALALYLALFPAIAAISAYYISTRLAKFLPEQSQKKPAIIPNIFILILAATWILSEWLRSVMFTGFGWNPLSASMIDTILAVFLPWIGSYGVSGLVIITAAISMMMLRQLTWTRIKAKNYWGLAIFPIMSILIYPSLSHIGPISSTRQPTNITIVQPNISQTDKYRPGYNQDNYQKLAELSVPLASQENIPRIILWPEAAIPDYLESGYPDRAYFDNIGGSAEGSLAALSTLMGPDDILLLGGTRLEWDNNNVTGARNSVMAVKKNDPNDSAKLFAHYDKSHLLPFGEYVPLRMILEPLGIARLVPGNIDFWSGDGPSNITIPHSNKAFAGLKIGMQICYELVFSGRVVNRDNRPDFIFSPSNDAWFGPWGPPQHEAQGRLRAIEEGLPVIRATPTGVSAIIQSDGVITDQIAAGIAGRIDANIPTAGPPTFFSKYGNIIPISLALLILLITIISTIAIGRRQG